MQYLFLPCECELVEQDGYMMQSFNICWKDLSHHQSNQAALSHSYKTLKVKVSHTLLKMSSEIGE